MYERTPERKPAAGCPHCNCSSVNGHGAFRHKDGTRHKRYLCRGCGRTFCRVTGTPVYYLKKRNKWSRFLTAILEGWSLRRSAGSLGIHLATAFSWRHRLLAVLSCQPQPVLDGTVTASEAYVPYSEKGSRKTYGPGSYGARRPTPHGCRPFRRMRDGKPSFVLLANSRGRHVVLAVSRGRPAPEQLRLALQRVLAGGAELLAEGLGPYPEACSRLNVRCRSPWVAAAAEVRAFLNAKEHRHNRMLHPWLRRFHGIATRYLQHYLAWYRLVRIPAASAPSAARLTLGLLSTSRRSPVG